MSSVAILVANVEYHNLSRLQCCHDDVMAMKELLEATQKYDEITLIENAESDDLKLQLRASVDRIRSPDELFFYFTGHGQQQEEDFFFCARNFDSRRPNETGLSNSELHTLLRMADASLVVKVIDACNSGTILLKSENGFSAQNKDGFKNIIQISSCLDSQNSLTGDPLSIFTEKFRSAALRKSDGTIFYTDIIGSLRDEFIENNFQTPFFVSQCTGREKFVEDAQRLEALRAKLEKTPQPNIDALTVDPLHRQPPPLSIAERLRAADSKVITPDALSGFVDSFFDGLIDSVSMNEFEEFFEVDVEEHSRFEEPSAERFILRVMANEKRSDNFVTANYSRKLRSINPMAGAALFDKYLDENRYEETAELYLNCKMNRAQIAITFTPKFMNLQRISLVVSCAPSLDHCYIFEMSTQHMLRDFGKYDGEGAEVSRRWWKMAWDSSCAGVVKQISEKLSETLRDQLDAAEARLSKENP